jgi:hypothetical protein
MFVGELGAAVQPGEYRDQLPASLVAACEQTVTTATVTAAASLGPRRRSPGTFRARQLNRHLTSPTPNQGHQLRLPY